MFSLDDPQRRLVTYLLAAGLMLIFFYFSLSTAVLKAPVTDEPLHLLRAVTLQQSGDLTRQGEHPPLGHRLIGLFLGGEETLPIMHQLASWDSGNRLEVSQELLWKSGVNVERFLVLARLPTILVGLLTAAFVAGWALSWQGKLAMLVALTLFVTSPNLIANAALATTDLLTAALIFTTVFMWWLYGRRQQKRWWLLTAIIMGLALASKLSTVILLPVTLVQLFLFPGPRRRAWRSLLAWLAMLPLALLCAWSAYGFESAGSVSGLSLIPAPSYWESWRILINHVAAGHPSFFWGTLSTDGSWFYFPVAFLIKTPFFTLFLLLLSLIVVFRLKALWSTALFLLIPVGALLTAATLSRLNIGYRHILPIIPFLLVFSSTSVLALRRRRLTYAILGFGLIWSLLAAAWQHPHHLAYFNEAVGGMAQGYRYLGDSNLDWGQDIKLLAQVVAAQSGAWHIAYYGPNDPAHYGLPTSILMDPLHDPGIFPVANPPPGTYAISANYLQGQLPDPDYFAWFQRQQPVDELGGSILIFTVEQQARGTWVAQCPDNAPLLTAAEAEALLDSKNARQLSFDCEQTFVLPSRGAPGWYILPQGESWWFQDQMPAVADRLQLVYRHHAVGNLPSFDVYYWPGLEGEDLSVGWMKMAETVQGDQITLPQHLSDVAELFAYLPLPGSWSTLWLITGSTVKPLSLQAHLYAPDEIYPQVADSLGFNAAQWQPGDWLVQRHDFPDQHNAGYLQTAMYNYLTMELLGEAVNLPAQMIEP